MLYFYFSGWIHSKSHKKCKIIVLTRTLYGKLFFVFPNSLLKLAVLWNRCKMSKNEEFWTCTLVLYGSYVIKRNKSDKLIRYLPVILSFNNLFFAVEMIALTQASDRNKLHSTWWLYFNAKFEGDDLRVEFKDKI